MPFTVKIEEITAFSPSSKGENDKNNKIREATIDAIINGTVPEDYFADSRWSQLRTRVHEFVQQLGFGPDTKIKCVSKGGRKFNYDFCFESYDNETQLLLQTRNIELKFNAATIDDAPQFVSPVKPSQYMDASYEEFYYDNYLPQLSATSGIPIPERSVYLAQLHSNKPKCVVAFQAQYYRGCSSSSKYTGAETDVAFYELAKRVSKESIAGFIMTTNLSVAALSEYLAKSQNAKIYMLYRDDRFTLQTANMDDYVIERVAKNPELNRYECVSKSGKKINVLLRWKNGNGIAFPAFQISGAK